MTLAFWFWLLIIWNSFGDLSFGICYLLPGASDWYLQLADLFRVLGMPILKSLL